MRPATPANANKPPAAALRDLIVTYFNEDEVRSLAFDLGLDYESLSGTSKIGKSGALVQQVARTGKIVDLVQQCRTMRPEANWNDVGVAAATNAQQFLFVPDDQPLINASPDRALRLGMVAGVILALVLVCGFGGGLAAGQVVAVTLKPVQPDTRSLESVRFEVGNAKFTPQSANRTFEKIASAISGGGLTSGTTFGITLDEVQATTLIDTAVKAASDAPITEPHIRFLGNGEATVNFRVPSFGNRRVALSYTVQASRGRLILTPKSGWFNVVDIPSTSIGWFPLPGNVQDTVTTWAQAQLDRQARWLIFTDALVASGTFSADATAR